MDDLDFQFDDEERKDGDLMFDKLTNSPYTLLMERNLHMCKTHEFRQAFLNMYTECRHELVACKEVNAAQLSS